MVYYSKITAKNRKEDVYKLFISYDADEESIILDDSAAHKHEDSVFQKLKAYLLDEKEDLAIDSLRSLGKTNREISKELQWFRDNDLNLIILDIPSSALDLVSPIQILSEAYEKLADVEIQNVKEGQREGIDRSREEKRPLGRKKIPYPDNWDKLYILWSENKLSTVEFIEQTGLKRATFYNLLKQYKKTACLEKQA